MKRFIPTAYLRSGTRYSTSTSPARLSFAKPPRTGLGNISLPYEAEDAPNSIPAPSIKLDDIGVDRWQYDLWHKIVRAALDGHPNQVDLSYHEGLNHPAASRYGATTPALLNWFKTFNRDRDYADQVKPFNFLNSFQARLQFELPDADQLAISKRGRPRKQSSIKPIAPFDKDMRKAAQFAFDRETGNSVTAGTVDDLRRGASPISFAA